MHFILSFKYQVSNASRQAVRPQYVPCVDGTNTVFVPDGYTAISP